MKTKNEYNRISQNISELNLHTKKFNKFSHTWNQDLLDLERVNFQSRAGKIIKNIRQQLSTLSTSQNSINNSYFPGLDSNPPSTASKKSLKTDSSLKKKPLAKIGKQPSLSTNLDDIQMKIKESKSLCFDDLFPKLPKNEEIETIQELFSIKNVLSESTLMHIRELEEKVQNIKNLNAKIAKDELSHIKSKRKKVLSKLRITQCPGFKPNNNKLKALKKSGSLTIMDLQ